MTTPSQFGKATNIGVGILHPKQQNRFTILFNSPSLTEDEQRTLSMQVVRFEDTRPVDHREFIEITFQDDVANSLLRTIRTLTDIAELNDLTIEVRQLDGNDIVLATWLFLECRLDLTVLNKLDYATGEAVEPTCVFEYQAWDLVLLGDDVDA